MADQQGDLAHRRRDRVGLLHLVEAVAVLPDHPVHPAHLTLDPA